MIKSARENETTHPSGITPLPYLKFISQSHEDFHDFTKHGIIVISQQPITLAWSFGQSALAAVISPFETYEVHGKSRLFFVNHNYWENYLSDYDAEGSSPGDKKHSVKKGSDLLQLSEEDWINSRFNCLNLPLPDNNLVEIPGYQ